MCIFGYLFYGKFSYDGSPHNFNIKIQIWSPINSQLGSLYISVLALKIKIYSATMGVSVTHWVSTFDLFLITFNSILKKKIKKNLHCNFFDGKFYSNFAPNSSLSYATLYKLNSVVYSSSSSYNQSSSEKKKKQNISFSRVSKLPWLPIRISTT